MIWYDLVWWGHLQTRVHRHSWGSHWRATRSHQQSRRRLCKSKKRWAPSQSYTAGDDGDGDGGEFTFMKVMVMVMVMVMVKALIRLKMMEMLIKMTLPCQWLRCHDGQHKETRHSRQRWFSQLRHLNLFFFKGLNFTLFLFLRLTKFYDKIFNTYHSPGWECPLPVQQTKGWGPQGYKAFSGKFHLNYY